MPLLAAPIGSRNRRGLREIVDGPREMVEGTRGDPPPAHGRRGAPPRFVRAATGVLVGVPDRGARVAARASRTPPETIAERGGSRVIPEPLGVESVLMDDAGGLDRVRNR